jgi:hypothetical protein
MFTISSVYGEFAGRSPPYAGLDTTNSGHHPVPNKGAVMTFILWIIAVVLVVAGIVSIVRGGLLWGIALIVLGLVVGPGGYSIFK